MRHLAIMTALAGCLALVVADASCSDDGSEFVPCKSYDECGGGSVGGSNAGGGGAGPNAALSWASVWGDSEQQFAWSVATDRQGSIYVAGYYTGTINLAGVTLPPIVAGTYDIFVVKLDTDGTALWAMPFGQTGGPPVEASEIHVGVDSDDHLLVAGRVLTTTTIGLSSQVSYQQNGAEPELFVAKLDGDGAVLWADHLADGSTRPVIAGMGTDSSDNVYIGGLLQGNGADFGSKSFTPSSPDVGVLFIAKLDVATGDVLWVTPWEHTTTEVSAGGLGVSPTGEATLAGSFQRTLHAQSGDVASSGQDVADIYVIGADADGGEAWVKRFGDAVGVQNCQAVVTGADGTIYLAGGFDSELDFGTGALTSAAPAKLDIYVAALDAAGKGTWAASYGAVASQAFGIDIDGKGALAVVGGFQGTVSFSNPSLASKGNIDAFILGLDPSGATSWARSVGGLGDQYALDVSIGPSGEANFVGRINGDVELPGEILTHAGGDDILVGQVKP